MCRLDLLYFNSITFYSLPDVPRGVISGTAVEEVVLEIRVKCGYSRSNSSWDRLFVPLTSLERPSTNNGLRNLWLQLIHAFGVSPKNNFLPKNIFKKFMIHIWHHQSSICSEPKIKWCEDWPGWFRVSTAPFPVQLALVDELRQAAADSFSIPIWSSPVLSCPSDSMSLWFQKHTEEIMQ